MTQSYPSLPARIKSYFLILVTHKIFITFILPIGVLAISAYLYFINSLYISTDNAYIRLASSAISMQVDGIVEDIKVKNNQQVNEGDILFTLDQTPFLIDLDNAKANLANSVNQIQGLKASYYSKQAQLNSAQADLDFAQKQYNRARDLSAKNTLAESDADEAKKKLENATQSIKIITEEMNQNLASLNGDVSLPLEKHAIYLEAKAKLDKANFDLNNSIVKSPVTGIVSNFYLKKGVFVSRGSPIFSIIDNKDIWVEANFKETQLTKIRPGQKANITIDTYPGKVFEAMVVSITPATGSEFSILPAQNSSGNWVKVIQRVMVRLEFTNKELQVPVSSGMSSVVTIDLKSK